MRCLAMVTSETLPALDARQELRIADLVAAAALTRILEEIEQRHQQQADDDPDREVPKIGIHRDSFMPWGIFGLPPCPGHCHAAPPLGEDHAGFNIGVYRIFAKRGARAAISFAAMPKGSRGAKKA